MWKALETMGGDASGPSELLGLVAVPSLPSFPKSLSCVHEPSRLHLHLDLHTQQDRFSAVYSGRLYTGNVMRNPIMTLEAGHKQLDAAGAFLDSPDNMWWKQEEEGDVSTLFFPGDFLEPTTPETFLELDPAGMLSIQQSHAMKAGWAGRRGAPTPSSNNGNCWGKLEPSREPCTDEIPWTDLVFWLGNATTGEVVCSCAQCCAAHQRSSGDRAGKRNCHGSLLRRRYAPYYQQQQQQRRMSSKIPVINLPRIEGVN
ncbi:hypothetical protein BBJ28_00010571 [Nothophytophthora sp. Chile5]|nr:hypothetical protein BBJ28_00010571 [Nothophytophthora sp. Chile5]